MSKEKEIVPFLDLRTPHRQLADQILPLWKEILENAAFIGGPHVSGFETEFAAFTGCDLCVGVNSGTDALRLALLAMGIKPGDEVVTVPNTFIATTEAISQAGGVPVFVDVDNSTATMDPEKLEQAITSKTKFVLPVHLYGQTADMSPIRRIAARHKLRVLEDASQAHGAEYYGERAGSMGDAAVFSFYPGKNLGACGEAGAIVTSNADVAKVASMLRDHGQAKKYYHDLEGFNARLDALQAAALRVKLKYLDTWTDQRRAVAAQYRQCLVGSGVVIPAEVEGRKHVYHLFVIRHAERDAIQSKLQFEGIETGLHYPVPLHLQAAYKNLKLRKGSFPVSEQWAEHGLSLPMFPDMTRSQVDRVCDVILSMKLQSQ